MLVQITGKKFDVGEALSEHTEDKIHDLVRKYSLEPVECTVVIFKANSHDVRVDLDLHLSREVHVRAHAETDDPHVSVDTAIHNLEKRIRKHKSRIVDHQKKRDVDFEKLPAQQYVLNPLGEEDTTSMSSEGYPLIIAETKTHIPHLTVVEAVTHMDLGDQNAVVFHNEAVGRINVVYRRSDGNIGWIDPAEE